MTEQQIFNFNSRQDYLEENFIKDYSNEDACNFFNKFPSWENKLINLIGDKKSGKTFMLKIFKKKNDFFYIDDLLIFQKEFDKLFSVNKLILDDIDIQEDKLFSLINNFILHKKYLIISSKKPLTKLNINLSDLRSRMKQFFLLEIKNPSDQLIFSLIFKYFSDHQIFIKKELIEHITKKIDRSYSRINEFLSKLNDLSIIKKKKIDYKLINEVIDTMI